MSVLPAELDVWSMAIDGTGGVLLHGRNPESVLSYVPASADAAYGPWPFESEGIAFDPVTGDLYSRLGSQFGRYAFGTTDGPTELELVNVAAR